jgi:hypothetical protein
MVIFFHHPIREEALLKEAPKSILKIWELVEEILV